jgi:hypothetical protein
MYLDLATILHFKLSTYKFLKLNKFILKNWLNATIDWSRYIYFFLMVKAGGLLEASKGSET